MIACLWHTLCTSSGYEECGCSCRFIFSLAESIFLIFESKDIFKKIISRVLENLYRQTQILSQILNLEKQNQTLLMKSIVSKNMLITL